MQASLRNEIEKQGRTGRTVVVDCRSAGDALSTESEDREMDEQNTLKSEM